MTRVVNSYGPQTRALGSGQEQSPSKPVVKEEVGPDGVEERLNNIETHLKMKGMADQKIPKEKFAVFKLSSISPSDQYTYTVLEMAGRQVAKCDQKSFWATSFGQKYVYLSPEDLSLGDQL